MYFEILNSGFYVYFIISFLSIHELNELLYPLHFMNNLSFLVFIIFQLHMKLNLFFVILVFFFIKQNFIKSLQCESYLQNKTNN